MSSFLLLGTLLFVYMTVWFIISLIQKRNDVADIAWGLGFVLLAWVSLISTNVFHLRGLLTTIVVTIWGLRLATHIYLRHQRSLEDSRYAKWREDWGQWFYLRSYLQVFLLQGLLLFLIVFSVLAINLTSATSLNLIDFLGLLVWAIGFFFEATADQQLKDFLRDPKHKGQLMTSGLYRYSRHPNYFGEVTQWWGLFLISINSNLFPLTIISPLTITTLILFVSGVPLLEKKYVGRPDWEEYKKNTSIFFPLPPKN